MTVSELINELSKLDPNMGVLCEFDADGDEFMMKVDVEKVYVGDSIDDTNMDEFDEETMYCIIKLKY